MVERKPGKNRKRGVENEREGTKGKGGKKKKKVAKKKWIKVVYIDKGVSRGRQTSRSGGVK